MYIVFELPSGPGGVGAYVYNALLRNLRDWGHTYNIPYTTKNYKFTVRVTFNDDKFYDFFALTWQPQASQLQSYLTNYRFVEPMNRV